MAKPKKVETWKWRAPGSTKDVEIVVRLGYADSRQRDPKFFVSLPDFDINDCDTDIGVLQKRVYEVLKGRYTIEWRRVFYITYGSRHPVQKTEWDGEGQKLEVTGIETWEQHVEEKITRYGDAKDFPTARDFRYEFQDQFEVQEIELGTYPDGTKCHRDGGKLQSGWPDTTNVWMDIDSHQTRNRNIGVFIPATVENRKALHLLFQAFADLDLRLRHILGHDTLPQILMDIAKSGTPTLLPWAKPAEPKIVSEMQEHTMAKKKKGRK